MAQLVERVLGKDEVGGSNPPSSSKGHRKMSFIFTANLLHNYNGRGRHEDAGAIPSQGSLQIRLVAPKRTLKSVLFSFTADLLHNREKDEVGVTLASSLFRHYVPYKSA